MSDLTDKFTTLESQLSAQHTETQSSIADLQTALDFLGTSLDIIIANNATNTRMLLAAIGQNSPCMPCPTPAIVIPPTGSTGLPVDEDACKRAQAFLNFMEAAFTVLDIASAVGIGFNPSLITDAFNQVIASLSGGDSPNAISFPEGVQLVGDMINYVALNLLRGATLVDSFAPLYFDLRDAMYIAGSGSAAQSAYVAVVNGSALDSDIKEVIKHAAYNDLFTYFFDPTSSPDLTGIDGSVCAGGLNDITSCTDFVATPATSGGHSFYIVQLPPSYSIFPLGIAGDYYGWSFQIIASAGGAAMSLYYWDTSDVIHFWDVQGVGADPMILTDHSNAIILQSDQDAGAIEFTVRICPPA